MNELVSNLSEFSAVGILEKGREALDARRWFSNIEAATEGGAGIVSKFTNQFSKGGDAFKTFKDEAIEDGFSLNRLSASTFGVS